ncbi:Serine/threonine-protein kinase PrkC [Gimesia alba]|uniref:non-specific serine/threonine protein kinase n=1 Tax=Gimesia alba TaxID=2527973 RepID=A0A517RDP8_9PLAN|nr:protein kinase [Gimesia alba]QDT42001.1 Serine/threonine-protein kinase PrkC [Gimesia alba]
MIDGSVKSETHQSLTAFEGENFSRDEIYTLIADLADQVYTLHQSQRLHLRIAPDEIFLDQDGKPELSVADESRIFRHTDFDQQLFPPELQSVDLLEVSVNRKNAAAALRKAGLQLDPERIDVYQLGALLCYLLTGEKVDAYLRSPRSRAKVPTEFRALIDRTLGFEPAAVIRDIESFRAALRPLQADLSESDAIDSVELFTSQSGSELPFQRLGHYQIRKRIGQGGMGDVYLGYESALDRQVAIKVLPFEFARQDEFVKRFYAEATAAARLVHPNIIPIYFIGEDQGYHYFVMQYVEGETLADLLKRKSTIEITQTLTIIEQVLCGLAAAHAEGMIHRDIKPGNILLDRINHKVLLADFGLVKSLLTKTEMTASGVIMGTVDYISPEQGRGLPVDPRSDLYSLGVLTYQMLTGRLPFQADSPTSMIFQHAYETPEPIHKLAPDVPEPLVRIINRLMAKLPVERYESAELVMADLREFRLRFDAATEPRLQADSSTLGNSNVSRSDSIREPSWTTIIESPRFEALLLPDACEEKQPSGFWKRQLRKVQDLFRKYSPELLQQLKSTQQQFEGAIQEYQWRQSSLETLYREAESSLQELNRLADRWQSAAEEAQSRAETAAKTDLKQQAFQEQSHCRQQAEEVRRQSVQQQEQLESMALQRAQINARLQQLICQRDLLNARIHAAHARGAVLGTAPQDATAKRNLLPYLFAGTLVASACLFLFWKVGALLIHGWDGDESRFEVADEKSTLSGELPAHFNRQLSEDGYQQQGIAFPSMVKDLIFCPSMIGGGYNSLATSHADGTVNKMNVTERSYNGPHFLTEHLESTSRLAYSLEGDLLAMSLGDGSISVWSTYGNGREFRRLKGHTDVVQSLLFTPDGKQLLSGGQDQTVRLWDIKTGHEIKRFPARNAVRSLAWNRERDGFYLSDGDGFDPVTLRQIKLSGEKETGFSYTGKKTPTFLFVPDSGDIGFSAPLQKDQSLNSWNRLTGEKGIFFGTDVVHAAVSANGLQVLTADSKGLISLWNSETGAVRQQMKVVDDPQIQKVCQLAVSRDGTLAACALSNWSEKEFEVRVWKLPQFPRDGYLINCDSPVNTVMFSPDGYEIVAGDRNRIRSWKLEKLNRESTFPVNSPVSALCSMSDGSGIIYATGSSNSRVNYIGVRPWKNFGRIGLQTGEYDDVHFEGHQARITSVDCASSARMLVSGSLDGSVRLWNLADREQVGVLELQRPVYSVCFKPQSEHEVYVCSNSRMIELWDLREQKKLKEFSGMSFQVLCMDLSEDGTRLVAGGGDRTVRVWDTESGELLATLEGHSGPVHSVAMPSITRFNLPGSYVVSGSEDATVRYWDIGQKQEISCFTGHSAAVSSVAISPRNEFVVSGSIDGTIRRWKLRKSF